MANSKYKHVKHYEKQDVALPSTYIVVRIDGRGFHKFSNKYAFVKPNEHRALNLMNDAATAVLKELPDIVIAYGMSDEFSFVFDPSCNLFERRESKILSTVVSTFTSYYVHLWPSCFPLTPLTPPLPSFDGRIILYPSTQLLRDYLSWRQVDCHINNLYNTTFWALVQKGGMMPTEAELELKGTLAAKKNEILFSKFGMNYNNEAEIFKKGTVIYRTYESTEIQPVGHHLAILEDTRDGMEGTSTLTKKGKERKRRSKAEIKVEHVDLIKDGFWLTKPWLLVNQPGQNPVLA